jgi:predicted MarR family transcription regulator
MSMAAAAQSRMTPSTTITVNNNTPYHNKHILNSRRMEMRYKSVSDLDSVVNESRNQEVQYKISKVIKNNASFDLNLSLDSSEKIMDRSALSRRK